MTGPIAVVTDSAACLPADVPGVATVPLHVVVGDEDLLDGVELSSTEVAAALRVRRPVTTSRPSPAELLAVYQRLADEGAAGVCSVHLSSALSGTADSARLAAEQSPVPVRVVDAHSLGMGVGFAVLAAARTAAEGAGLEAVAAAAQRTAAATTVFFSMDSLEHLRRGGRLGAAQAWLGSALAVKPLLRVQDGRVEPFEKVRTSSRAVARLEELAAGCANDRSCAVAVAVHHLDSSTRAEQLAGRLRQRLPGVDVLVVEVSGAVGAHVGPGLLGVVVAPT